MFWLFLISIERDQASLWLVRPGLGYIFMVSLCRVSLFVRFFFNFITCFSLLCFGFLFSEIESFGLGLSFDFFVFYLVLAKLEL